jgi:hypothetical protein
MSRVCLGVEVTADRARTVVVAATLAVAARADIRMLPPVDGTGTAPAEIARMCAELGDAVEWVAADPRSNAAPLIEPLRRIAGVRVKTPSAEDVAIAHGRFIDLLNAGKLRHHNQPDLTAAVRFATPRRLSGASAIQRYGGPVDPAPAVAAELAVWALGDISEVQHEPGAWLI